MESATYKIDAQTIDPQLETILNSINEARERGERYLAVIFEAPVDDVMQFEKLRLDPRSMGTELVGLVGAGRLTGINGSKITAIPAWTK